MTTDGFAHDDFGHVISRRPAAVATPGTIQELADLIARAAREGRVVVPRGEGHSTGGQAQSDGGVVADLRRLDAVVEIGPDRVLVEAGARWSHLLDATLPHGLTPPVLTNFLELSVGGTLAAGGIGGTAHRHGLQVDGVLALDVVTGRGEVVRCGPGDRLFDDALGGLGTCAVIARAELALVPAPGTVRRLLVPCADVPALMAAQRAVVADGCVDYVEGFLQGDGGGGWTPVLDVATHRSGPRDLDPGTVLHELGIGTGDAVAADLGYRDFLRRMDAGVAEQVRTGAWGVPHPSIYLLLPDTAGAERFVTDTVRGLTAGDVGPTGIVFVYPVRRTARALPPVPAGPSAFFFAILRAAPRDDAAAVAAMVADNVALRRAALGLGGVVYQAGTLPMAPQDWRDHFGDRWPGLLETRARHDPAAVLGSSLGLGIGPGTAAEEKNGTLRPGHHGNGQDVGEGEWTRAGT